MNAKGYAIKFKILDDISKNKVVQYNKNIDKNCFVIVSPEYFLDGQIKCFGYIKIIQQKISIEDIETHESNIKRALQINDSQQLLIKEINIEAIIKQDKNTISSIVDTISDYNTTLWHKESSLEIFYSTDDNEKLCALLMH